jgi:hypothetical protein
MAATISTWEQSAQFDPTNPNQITHVRYTGIPGGYGSFYYNRVPNQSTLLGASLGDVTSPSTWPSWLQALAVAGIGGVVGFWGMRHYGGAIKKKLGLSGHRRRR